jgi:sugar transferase EpsL
LPVAKELGERPEHIEKTIEVLRKSMQDRIAEILEEAMRFAPRQKGLPFALKRLIDCVIASVGLAVLSPMLLLVSVIIFFAMGPPVFYRQTRPGRHGRPFSLLKFRTMSKATDFTGTLLPDERRLGRVGRFIRSLSLDELPQLWNVLRGDISLVGPRPLLMQYLDRYTPEQARRHEVLPGITGWAQIHGRNALSWEEKFKLDVWYVDNWSLGLDLEILARTVVRVLKREGIAQSGSATAPEFMGSEQAQTTK